MAKEGTKNTFGKAELKRIVITAAVVGFGSIVGTLVTELSKAPQSESVAIPISIMVLKAIQYYLQGK